MRKLMIFAFLLAAATGWGYAQLRETPEAVRAFLENYTNDSTERQYFLSTKGFGSIPDSVQLKDLSVRAIEAYYVKSDSIDMYPDTVPLSEIIRPMGLWLVLVMAHNKPLYQQFLGYNGMEQPRTIGGTFPSPGSDLKNPMWLSLLETYPQSTGINPVLVQIKDKNIIFNVGNNFAGGNNFLYFKQLGPRKIYYIKPEMPWLGDTLKTLFSGSIRTLDDSKKLVEFLKKRELNKKKVGSDERIMKKSTDVKPQETKPLSGSNSIWMSGGLDTRLQ